MLRDEKILITGVSGMVGAPVAAYLATNNDVWGLARFGGEGARGAAIGTDPSGRAEIDRLGVTTRAVDLADPDLTDLPDDFTYVIHLAHTRMGADFWRAVQINAVGAGELLHHCRKAKAALVMSSAAVYSPKPDVFHAFNEDDDLGKAVTPWAPSSPASKVSLEAVSRFCAEAFDLPMVITRMNTIYGEFGDVAVGLPVMNMDSVVAGDVIDSLGDPNVHSPIHLQDVCEQIEPLLAAASSPALTVNWAGDEMVTLQQWCAQAAALARTSATINVNWIPGALNGNAADVTRL